MFCILVIDIYVICIFLLPDCCLGPLYIYIQTSNQKQNCSKWRIFGLFIKIYCSRLWIIVDLQKEDKFSQLIFMVINVLFHKQEQKTSSNKNGIFSAESDFSKVCNRSIWFRGKIFKLEPTDATNQTQICKNTS